MAYILDEDGLALVADVKNFCDKEVKEQCKEYDRTGEWPKEIYDKAIELKPDFVAAYYNRGVSYLKQNEFKKALEDFDKYIQFVPNDPDGYQMRGKCYEALGDTAKAQADLDKAKELAKNG